MTKNLTGMKFGRWTVVGIAEKRRNGNSGTRVFWECLCECGNKGIVVTHVLTRGSSKSCGCYKKEYPRRKLPSGVSERNHLLRTYKKGAEARGLCFDLTVEQFTELIHQNCFYCGISPRKSVKGDGLDKNYIYNGIDRLDNSKGYFVDNCVTCCETCNRAKRTMSVDEFIDWIDRLIKHRKSKTLFGLPIISVPIDFQDDQTAKWYRDLFVDAEGISK